MDTPYFLEPELGLLRHLVQYQIPLLFFFERRGLVSFEDLYIKNEIPNIIYLAG